MKKMLKIWSLRLQLLFLRAQVEGHDRAFNAAVKLWHDGQLTYDEGPLRAGRRCGQLRDAIARLECRLAGSGVPMKRRGNK